MDCNDSEYCNGTEICQGGECVPDSPPPDEGVVCSLDEGSNATISFCHAGTCTGLYRTDVNTDCTIGNTSKGPSQNLQIGGAGSTSSSRFFAFNYCETFDFTCSPKLNICRISDADLLDHTGGTLDGSYSINDMSGPWAVGDYATVGFVTGGSANWNPGIKSALLSDTPAEDVNLYAVSTIPTIPNGNWIALAGSRQANEFETGMIKVCSTAFTTCANHNLDDVSFTAIPEKVKLVPCSDPDEEGCEFGLKAIWAVYKSGDERGVAYGEKDPQTGAIVPSPVYTIPPPTQSGMAANVNQIVLVEDDLWVIGDFGLFLRCFKADGTVGCTPLQPWADFLHYSIKGAWVGPNATYVLAEKYLAEGQDSGVKLAILPKGKSPGDGAAWHVHTIDTGDPSEAMYGGFTHISGSSAGPILYGVTGTIDAQKIRVEAPGVLQP
jgi:hypothetical protein